MSAMTESILPPDDLRRQVKLLQKVVDHQAIQILNLSRYQQKSALEDGLSALTREVAELREAADAQGAALRRQRAEMAAMAAEAQASRRLNQNQRAEMRQLATVAMSEVRVMKAEYEERLAELGRRRDEDQRLRREFQDLKDSFERSAEVRERVVEVEQQCKKQSLYARQCLEAIVMDIKAFKVSVDERQDRADTAVKEALGSATDPGSLAGLKQTISRLSEEVDQFKESFHEQRSSIDDLVKDMEDAKQTQQEKTSQTESTLDEHSARFAEVLEQANAFMKKCQREVREEQARLVRDLSATLAESARAASEAARRERERTAVALGAVEERMDELDAMHDDMQDRLFEVDKARRNNLIFYGVRSRDDEGGEECAAHIKNLFNTYLQVTREIPLTKVEKLWNGPSFRGFKPIQVSFQLFKDREEIMRKAPKLLKGTNVYVTEDFSRKVRKHREELTRFAKAVQEKTPSARCRLQYDRLIVDNQAFLFNELEGRVETVKTRAVSGAINGSAKPRHHILPLPRPRANTFVRQGRPATQAENPLVCSKHHHRRDAPGDGLSCSSDEDCGEDVHESVAKEGLGQAIDVVMPVASFVQVDEHRASTASERIQNGSMRTFEHHIQVLPSISD